MKNDNVEELDELFEKIDVEKCVYKCQFCKCKFKSESGLNKHQGVCDIKIVDDDCLENSGRDY